MSNPEEFGPGGPGGELPPPPEEPEEEEPDEDPSDYIGPGMDEDDPPDPPPKPPKDDDDDDDDDYVEPPPDPPPDPDPGDDFGPGSGGYIAPPPIPPPIIDDSGLVDPPDPIQDFGDTPSPDRIPDTSDDTVSSQTTEVLLQSAADQHQAKLEELYEKKRSGKLSAAEYAAKKKRLESRHIRLVNYLQTGTGLKGRRKSAVDKWAAKTEVLVKQAAVDHIAAVKDALAGYATLTATEVLRLRAEGKITASQQAELIAQIETQHLANLLGVDQGVLGGTPFSLSYTAVETTTTLGLVVDPRDLAVAAGIGRGQLPSDEKPGVPEPEWDVYKGWRKEFKEEQVRPWFFRWDAHWDKTLKDSVPQIEPPMGPDTERGFEAIGVEQRPSIDRDIADKILTDFLTKEGPREVEQYDYTFMGDTEHVEEITAAARLPVPYSQAGNVFLKLFDIEADMITPAAQIDTLRGYEVPGGRKEVELEPIIFEPAMPLPIIRLDDTLRPYEAGGVVRPDVDIVDVTLKELQLPLGVTEEDEFIQPLADTERPHEVTVEQRPVSTKIVPLELDFSVDAPYQPADTRQVTTREDVLRPEEITGIEERPPSTAPPELFLEMAEKPFRELSTKLRETGKDFRAEGLEKEGWYAQMMYAGVGLALRGSASAIEGVTMPIRPLLVAGSVHSLVLLSTSVEARSGVIEAAVKDPAGMAVDIFGGFIGGYALGRGIGWYRQRAATKFLADYPEEAFFHPDEMMQTGYRYGYPETEIVQEQALVDVIPEEARVVDTTSNVKFKDRFEIPFEFYEAGDDLPSHLKPDSGPWKPSQVGAASDEAIAQSKYAKDILDKARLERELLKKGWRKGYRRDISMGDSLDPVLLPPEAAGTLVPTGRFRPVFSWQTVEKHFAGLSTSLAEAPAVVSTLPVRTGILGGLTSIRAKRFEEDIDVGGIDFMRRGVDRTGLRLKERAVTDTTLKQLDTQTQFDTTIQDIDVDLFLDETQKQKQKQKQETVTDLILQQEQTVDLVQVPVVVQDIIPIQDQPAPTRPQPYFPAPPPPRRTARRWVPEEDDIFKEWVRPSYGVKRLGRTVKIGTPEQALRGILRPPKPFRKPTKRKKKKKDEVDDLLGFLF